MELREFVRTTLIEIMQGVQDAQLYWTSGENKGAINPIFGEISPATTTFQEINFDVAVTATDQKSGGVGGGIKVFSVNLSGEAQKSLSNSTVSRVVFKVPFLPPPMILL